MYLWKPIVKVLKGSALARCLPVERERTPQICRGGSTLLQIRLLCELFSRVDVQDDGIVVSWTNRDGARVQSVELDAMTCTS